MEIEPAAIENFDFPRNSLGEKFSTSNCYKILKNGERVWRKWLVYSKFKDSVFCFCCKIFGSIKMKLTDTSGFSDWHHIQYTLSKHEISLQHLDNHKKWINLRKSLTNETTIDKAQQKLFKEEKKRWYAVVERIIAVIQLLSQQCLAFRGSSDKLYERDNGNFLKIIEMIAKFDNVMAEHIRRVQSFQAQDKRGVHYLGNRIQNEIINILATEIRNTILNNIKKAKYFSIILDCTPDTSHTEQISVVLRYVSINENNVEIKEHFISFCPIYDTTGVGLKLFVLDELKNLGLDIKNLRGQGYDNSKF